MFKKNKNDIRFYDPGDKDKNVQPTYYFEEVNSMNQRPKKIVMVQNNIANVVTLKGRHIETLTQCDKTDQFCTTVTSDMCVELRTKLEKVLKIKTYKEMNDLSNECSAVINSALDPNAMIKDKPGFYEQEKSNFDDVTKHTKFAQSNNLLSPLSVHKYGDNPITRDYDNIDIKFFSTEDKEKRRLRTQVPGLYLQKMTSLCAYVYEDIDTNFMRNYQPVLDFMYNMKSHTEE